MTLTILVCGDRYWNNQDSIYNILKYYPTSTTLIHGNCKGVDKLTSKVGKLLGMVIIPFSANWTKYGLSAGPIRNQEMLDVGLPDEVLAFHSDMSRSKGTLDMVTRAKRHGIKIRLFSLNMLETCEVDKDGK